MKEKDIKTTKFLQDIYFNISYIVSGENLKYVNYFLLNEK